MAAEKQKIVTVGDANVLMSTVQSTDPSLEGEYGDIEGTVLRDPSSGLAASVTDDGTGSGNALTVQQSPWNAYWVDPSIAAGDVEIKSEAGVLGGLYSLTTDTGEPATITLWDNGAESGTPNQQRGNFVGLTEYMYGGGAGIKMANGIIANFSAPPKLGVIILWK